MTKNKKDTNQVISNIHSLSIDEIVKLAEKPYCITNLAWINWYIFSNNLKQFYNPENYREIDSSYDNFLPPRDVKAVISAVKLDIKYDIDIDVKEISYIKSLSIYAGMKFFAVESALALSIGEIHELVPLLDNVALNDDYVITYHCKNEAAWSLMIVKRKFYIDSSADLDVMHINDMTKFLEKKV